MPGLGDADGNIFGSWQAATSECEKSEENETGRQILELGNRPDWSITSNKRADNMSSIGAYKKKISLDKKFFAYYFTNKNAEAFFKVCFL